MDGHATNWQLEPWVAQCQGWVHKGAISVQAGLPEAHSFNKEVVADIKAAHGKLVHALWSLFHALPHFPTCHSHLHCQEFFEALSSQKIATSENT